MIRREGRRLRAYALVAVLSGPLAMWRPDARTEAEHRLALGVQCLQRPWVLLGGEVAAATATHSTGTARLRDSFERALSLPPPSFPGFESLVLHVRRVEGRGGAGWPDVLLLEAGGLRPELVEGRPVLHGSDLVGFVRSEPEDRDRLAREGLLRVELLCHRRAGRIPRRIVGKARSEAVRSEAQAEPPAVRAVVEAGEPEDPLPLRSVRSAPEQCDTGLPGVPPWPYLLRTMASPELLPGLPEGLVVGVLRDKVYAAEGFVQQRYVLPRWHPLSLVRVEVLVPEAEGRGLASPTMAEPRGIPVRVLWSSPPTLGFRRYLLRGRGLTAGAAVVAGGRCLGRVEVVLGELAVAVPLARRGNVVPLLFLAEDGGLEALVVEGLGSGAGCDRFRIVHPEVPGLLGRGTLHTGTLGREFPSGLILGRSFAQHGDRLEVPDLELRDWPVEVEVLAGRAP